MTDEIRYGTVAVRREGKRIFIDSGNYDEEDPLRPDVVVVLTDDGGISLDPEWKRDLDSKIAHAKVWQRLLDKLDLSHLMYDKLVDVRPPRFISEESMMIEYLRAIASGDVLVREFGKTSRNLLAQSLGLTFPERRK